ncbi:MFS transporter [Pseudonocardia zijingensis]|uniref:MFS transporter n=1 Tax=Pseudonocardia zijingensis TaxID=153376 RepID=A0ABP3ZG18_9PSEU
MSDAPESTAPESTRQPSAARIITAACVGNALEWYDIAVYSYFAVYVAQVFFPAEDPTTGLLLALGTFAVSFLIRPIGAVVLGSYADRAGRKPALALSIALMVLGTLIIVVMPPYEVVGLLAPIGILVARLIQGFSAGGEFGSSTALMVEHLPGRRGFAASWQFTSQSASTLLAATLGTVLTSTLTQEQLLSWGFRIPFAVGLLVGPVGWYIRRHVPEAPEFTRTDAAEAGHPGLVLLREQKVRVLLTIGVLAATTCLNYLITYMPTFAIKNLGLPASVGFAGVVVGGIALLIATPLAGHYSDRFTQIRIMVPAAVLILVLIYPLFTLLVAVPGLTVMLGMLAVLGVLKAAYFGPMGALIAGLFPAETRATGMAVGYNIGVAVFGGFTPLIAAWLITTTGSPLAPSFWVMATAALSLGALATIRRLGLHRPPAPSGPTLSG